MFIYLTQSELLGKLFNLLLGFLHTSYLTLLPRRFYYMYVVEVQIVRIVYTSTNLLYMYNVQT